MNPTPESLKKAEEIAGNIKLIDPDEDLKVIAQALDEARMEGRAAGIEESAGQLTGGPLECKGTTLCQCYACHMRADILALKDSPRGEG